MASAPLSSASPLPWVEGHADVVVVGAGLAGIVAAIELLRAGRRVCLLDRDAPERIGGQARESFGGILAVDTPAQRRLGVRDSVALALEDWLRFGELTPEEAWPYAWAQAYVRDSRREVYDWLRGFGVGFLPVPQWPERRGNRVPRWHVVWGTGERLVQCLVRGLQRAPAPGQLTLRHGVCVEALLMESGRVAGVRGHSEDGTTPCLVRAPTVLVASGGITGDLARVRALWPGGAAPPELLQGAHRYGDGRLHDACRALGARVEHLERMWNYAAGVRHWAPRQPDHGLSLVPPRSAAWLDAHGQRFDPPLLAGWDTSEAVARIAAQGGISWQVMNQHIARRELAVSGAECNPSIRGRQPLAFLLEMLWGNDRLVRTLVAQCADVVQGRTVAELARAMNALGAPGAAAVDAAALERTLREFDATLGSAADAQRRYVDSVRRWRGDRLRTARPGALLDPAHGPLIAVRERLLVRKTLGGIVTDLDGAVRDRDDRPIPGLYAAGEAAGFGGGGMNGCRALEGTFLGGAVYSARRAARGVLADLQGPAAPSARAPGARR